MEQEIKNPDNEYVRALNSVMECLRDLKSDPNVMQTGKLGAKENFTFANINDHFMKVRQGTVKQD